MATQGSLAGKGTTAPSAVPGARRGWRRYRTTSRPLTLLIAYDLPAMCTSLTTFGAHSSLASFFARFSMPRILRRRRNANHVHRDRP